MIHPASILHLRWRRCGGLWFPRLDHGLQPSAQFQQVKGEVPRAWPLTLQQRQQGLAGRDGPQVLVEQLQGIVLRIERRFVHVQRLDQLPFQRLDYGDAGQGHHHPVDVVVRRAVGIDLQQEPLSVIGLHLGLVGFQGLEHPLDVRKESVLTQQDVEVIQGPAQVSRRQAYQAANRRGETPDGQVIVQKEDGGARRVQQVVQVVVGAALPLALMRAAVGLGLVVFLLRRAQPTGYAVALSLIAGGALGNAIDGLSAGRVTDMLLSPALSRVTRALGQGDFPVFNLADVWVVGGVLLLLFVTVQQDRRRARVPVTSPE